MGAPLAVVVDAGSPRREDVVAALRAAGCCSWSATSADARTEVTRRRPALVLVAAGADPFPAVDCLRALHDAHPQPRYLFIAQISSEDLAIAAFHAGAERYVREPWTPSILQSSVRALVSADGVTEDDGLQGGERLIGRSPAIKRLRAQIARVAPTGSNVMILGETGAGKELAAELLHLNGARRTKPFVCLNTAAIPDALLENELFGHERGAFTGATTAQGGKLAAARGGTVFLDEIGDVSLAIQAKLLRALESRTIYRLGGTQSVPLDIRIIAATNQDLERAAAEGRFRRDLYYRLNVVRVELPPLRNRVEDIPLLIHHYLAQFNRQFGMSVRGLSPRAIDALCAHTWPGNVRELRNVIEALMVNLAPQATGTVDVPPEVMRQLACAVAAPTTERERLLDALTATNWNKSRAATQLRCSRMTLYRKLHQYKLASGR
jgi:DNA-binding NtrC family response regulator